MDSEITDVTKPRFAGIVKAAKTIYSVNYYLAGISTRPLRCLRLYTRLSPTEPAPCPSEESERTVNCLRES